MPEPDLDKQLRETDRPALSAEATKAQIRMTLMSARTSSRLGFALILLPVLFVGGLVLQYGLRLPVPGFRQLEDGLSWIEAHRFISLLSPVVLVGAPLAALAINVLAITHVEIARASREMRVTVKLRPVNIAIGVVALLITALVFVHSIADPRR